MNIDLIWHTGHWTGWTKSGLLPKWIVNTVDNDPQRTLDSIQIRPVQSGHRKNEQWALEKYTVDKTDMGKIHSGQDGHWKNGQRTKWTEDTSQKRQWVVHGGQSERWINCTVPERSLLGMRPKTNLVDMSANLGTPQPPDILRTAIKKYSFFVFSPILDVSQGVAPPPFCFFSDFDACPKRKGVNIFL